MGLLTAFVVAIVGAVAAAFIVAATMRQKGGKGQSPNLDENSIPIASEGETIPVVFGTREIRKSNVVNYGGYKNHEVEY